MNILNTGRFYLKAVFALAVCALVVSAIAPLPAQAVTSHRCNSCGTITNISKVKTKRSGSGVGLVLGAVAGGVVGHKLGDGNSAGTVIGAVGGGYAGNEIEKHNKDVKTYYKVAIRMDDGRRIKLKVHPEAGHGLAIGRRVRVSGGNIILLR